MKKSKRYIKKQNNKPPGYGNGEGGPNDWMYQQVIEAVAVFASHGRYFSICLLQQHDINNDC